MKSGFASRIFILTLILALSSRIAYCQEKPKPFVLNGYLSSMQSVIFDSVSGPYITDNLIHNRLNLKSYITGNITFSLELRNRVFTGDMLTVNPSFAAGTGTDIGLADMSWNLIDEQSVLFNTTVDRLWADFSFGSFQARIGRQRINWGQALVWNPNDIFNAYSYFDFDYVERPGSDAMRLQYFPSYSSAIELAVKADSENDITAALLYRFNKWGYDIQFLGGVSDGEDFVAGAGWSGAIGSLAFRGEMSLFVPAAKGTSGPATGIVTAGVDKVFGKGSSLQAQLMYCNNPSDAGNLTSMYSGSISAKDLAFSEFSAFGSFAWQATPLLVLGASAMWFPDLNGYFAGSSLDWSVAENVDLSVFWQHFRTETGLDATRLNLGFFRIKVSF